MGGYWLIPKGPQFKQWSITMKNKTNHCYLHLLLTRCTGVSGEKWAGGLWVVDVGCCGCNGITLNNLLTRID